LKQRRSVVLLTHSPTSDRRALRHVERNVDESYDVTERFAEVFATSGGHRVCAATDSSASLRDAHMGRRRTP
jgi:hypothetical protein